MATQSENEAAKNFDEKKDKVNPEAQSLLESYSNIKPDKVLQHVVTLRDEAFSVYHYSCIGQMRFLSFNLSKMPFYPRILKLLKSSPNAGFLDAGCCFGQEIRFLANQGIPHSQLYGCDLEQVFIDLGYRLFLDGEGKLGAKFFVGDLAQPQETTYENGSLAQGLKNKLQAIFASSLFHMWDYEEQVLVAKRMVAMCEDKAGVMITGRQLGSHLGGRYPMTGMRKDGEKYRNYRHNEQTIRGFWLDVGEATGTQWTVDAGTYWGEEMEQTKNAPWAEPQMCMIWWSATRK
jgi:SAM-dependent methyltransferase